MWKRRDLSPAILVALLSAVGGVVVTAMLFVAYRFNLVPVVGVVCLIVAIALLLVAAESWHLRRERSNSAAVASPAVLTHLERDLRPSSSVEQIRVRIVNAGSKGVASGNLRWCLRDGSTGDATFIGLPPVGHSPSSRASSFLVDLGSHEIADSGTDSLELSFRMRHESAIRVRRIEVFYGMNESGGPLVGNVVQYPDSIRAPG